MEAAELIHANASRWYLIVGKNWVSPLVFFAPSWMLLITKRPPHPSFLKINSDSSILDGGANGGVGFIFLALAQI